MIVQEAFTRIIHLIFAYPVVAVPAVASVTFEAVELNVLCHATAVRTHFTAYDSQAILVSVAVPPIANPKLPDVALIAEREYKHSNI